MAGKRPETLTGWYSVGELDEVELTEDDFPIVVYEGDPARYLVSIGSLSMLTSHLPLFGKVVPKEEADEKKPRCEDDTFFDF